MPILETPFGAQHYLVEARGTAAEAPNLVFLNSLGTDLRMWDHVVSGLGFPANILRIDKPGHGLSDAPKGELSIQDLASITFAAMDAVGMKRATIIGCSIGGLIAQQMALQAPDRIQKLILSNTRFQIGEAKAWQQRMDLVAQGGIAPLAKDVLQRWFGPQMLSSPELPMWRNMLLRTDAKSYIACCAAIAGCDLGDQVSQIQLPTLVLGGAHDQATPPQGVQELAERLANSTYFEFENSGHIPAIEEPEIFIQILTKFVTGIDD